MDGEKNAQSVITFSTILHRILPIIYKGSWKLLLNCHHDIPYSRIGLCLRFFFLYAVRKLIHQQHTDMFAHFVLFYFHGSFIIGMSLPVAIRQIHLYTRFLPVYPAEPVVIPVTYMNSLFPQKISFFICEKHRILLSICIEPERCQKRISQKIKHTVLADRHKESCQITVFICVQQCIGEFFRRKISAFYVCIRIHGFIEGLRQPSARLRILQDLFK